MYPARVFSIVNFKDYCQGWQGLVCCAVVAESEWVSVQKHREENTHTTPTLTKHLTCTCRLVVPNLHKPPATLFAGPCVQFQYRVSAWESAYHKPNMPARRLDLHASGADDAAHALESEPTRHELGYRLLHLRPKGIWEISIRLRCGTTDYMRACYSESDH